MQGILSLSETLLMMRSWARGAGAGWKRPSGVFSRPSCVPKDADQLLGLVVIGRQIVVGNGPVEALAVAAVRLEIVEDPCGGRCGHSGWYARPACARDTTEIRCPVRWCRVRRGPASRPPAWRRSSRKASPWCPAARCGAS